MKRISNSVWKSNNGEFFQEINTTDITACLGCDVRYTSNCIKHCVFIIGIGGYFKQITKEEAEKLMGKKKFIVKFVNHDENELVEAMCSAHAAILAQSRRIEMGEDDVTVKSVEPIIPYVITIDKYTVSVINGELTVKSHGEHVNMSANCGFVIMHLAKRIEELEKAQNTKNKLIENLLNEMKQDIKDLNDINILSKLKEMLGLTKGKQR